MLKSSFVFETDITPRIPPESRVPNGVGSPKTSNLLQPPSSEDFSQKSKCDPSEFSPQPEFDSDWNVNDLDDYFPPCYYYLPHSKHHIIKNPSSLTYSKPETSPSFVTIAQKHSSSFTKVKRTEKVIKILPKNFEPILIKTEEKSKKIKPDLQNSFYSHDRKKGYQIDTKSNLGILKEKFGDYLPDEILKTSFKKHDCDLKESIRECALEIGWNLTYPLRQDDIGRKVTP